MATVVMGLINLIVLYLCCVELLTIIFDNILVQLKDIHPTSIKSHEVFINNTSHDEHLNNTGFSNQNCK